MARVYASPLLAFHVLTIFLSLLSHVAAAEPTSLKDHAVAKRPAMSTDFRAWKEVGRISLDKGPAEPFQSCIPVNANSVGWPWDGMYCLDRAQAVYFIDAEKGRLSEAMFRGVQALNANDPKAPVLLFKEGFLGGFPFLRRREWGGQQDRLKNATVVAKAASKPILVTGHDDGTITILDVSKENAWKMDSIKNLSPITAAAISSNGDLIVTADYSREHRKSFIIRRVGTAEPKWDMEGLGTLKGEVREIAIAPDNPNLYAVAGPDNVTLFPLDDRKKQIPLPGTAATRSLAFSPDGRVLLTASEDGGIKLWDLRAGKLLKSMRAEKDLLWAGFMPGGNTAISLSKHRVMQHWSDQPLNAELSGSVPPVAARADDAGTREAAAFSFSITPDLTRDWASMAYISRSPEGYLSMPNGYRPIREDSPRFSLIHLFSYACKECAPTEQALAAWLKKLPPEVDYEKTPNLQAPGMEHYRENLEFLGLHLVRGELNIDIFDGLWRQGIEQGLDQSQLKAWLKNTLPPELLERIQIQPDGKNFTQWMKTLSRNNQSQTMKPARYLDMIREPVAVVIPTPHRLLVTSPDVAGGPDALIPALDKMLKSARQDFRAKDERHLRPRFSKSVTAQERELFEYDLQTLRSLKLADPTGELRRLFKIEEASGAAIEKWLADRIYTISKPEDVIDFVSVRTDVNFPGGSQAYASGTFTFNRDRSSHDQKKAVAIRDFGGYAYGRQRGQLLAIKIDDHYITQFGLRHGPIVLYEMYLMTYLPKPATDVFEYRKPNNFSELKNFFDSVIRLATLIHEARHGDGGYIEGAGQHVDCPPSIAGGRKGGCDPWANGACRFDAEFLRAVLAGNNAAVLASGMFRNGQTLYEYGIDRLIRSSLKLILGKEDGEDHPESIFDVPQDWTATVGSKKTGNSAARIKALTEFIVDRLSRQQQYIYGRKVVAPGNDAETHWDYRQVTQTKVASNNSCELTKHFSATHHVKRRSQVPQPPMTTEEAITVNLKNVIHHAITSEDYLWREEEDGVIKANVQHKNIRMSCIRGLNCVSAFEDDKSSIFPQLKFAINQLNNADEAYEVLRAFQQLVGLCIGAEEVANPNR